MQIDVSVQMMGSVIMFRFKTRNLGNVNPLYWRVSVRVEANGLELPR